LNYLFTGPAVTKDYYFADPGAAGGNTVCSCRHGKRKQGYDNYANEKSTKMGLSRYEPV
jgi:hypothetical protein